MDRAVVVLANQVLLGDIGSHQMTLSPRCAREHGQTIQSLHLGRQLAWVRLSTGDWLALVVIEAHTADAVNSLTMTLWLQRHQFMLAHPAGPGPPLPNS
ncbi:hypothetical protein [Mycobacteroides abscessus]|nr:hypothetical protein [Mycobacteroides abscessus]AWG62842.1 hypothetical protein DDT46_02850 [Mycobacteroides abscessus]PVA73704.1 hypothetical protein DDJ37_14920 [Mycobacteroides abscessus]PVB11958.1 hypothetical protein DDJ40_16470 [Mycobacteroides abscessus]PVB16651.1 hypothetical protein DDJ71_21105 [Mycobacteroides abscessus]RIR41900.1 hypothetical protein D2E39_20525 [Mycobacteroides abscessus]